LELTFEQRMSLSDDSSEGRLLRRSYTDEHIHISETEDPVKNERRRSNDTKTINRPQSLAAKEAIAVSKLVAKKL